MAAVSSPSNTSNERLDSVILSTGPTGLLKRAVAGSSRTVTGGDVNAAAQEVGTHTDDAAFTVATDAVVAIGALADETATDSVDEGDAGALRMTLDRRLLIASQDKVDDASSATGRVIPAGVVRDDALSTLTPVDGDLTYGRVDAQGALWVRTQPTVRISQTPAVSTIPAYTAKDAVGGLLTFAYAARITGGSGVLMGVTVIDNSQQRPALELVLFDRTFTASTDNAIFAPSDADLANAIGVVAINSWADFSTNSVATVSGVSLPFVLSGTSLFGQLVTRGTPTFVATTDITVLVTILQD